MCHRSPSHSLTVSRPEIDFVVKCRRNPDTVSALHPDQPVGPWGLGRGGTEDCWVIATHYRSIFGGIKKELIRGDNWQRLGLVHWEGLTIARVRWLLRAHYYYYYSLLHCWVALWPVGQLRLPGEQGRRWTDKQRSQHMCEFGYEKKHLVDGERRMWYWEFPAETGSNVEIYNLSTCGLGWINALCFTKRKLGFNGHNSQQTLTQDLSEFEPKHQTYKTFSRKTGEGFKVKGSKLR